jgi:hypothetical protein
MLGWFKRKETTVAAAMKSRYPWVNAQTHSRLLSQGMSFAFKDGLV